MTGRRLWLATAAAVAGIAITLALGFWQLGRGQQRDAIAASIAARKEQPAVPQQALLRSGASLPQLHHRTVQLRGRWSAAHTVFLDNRQMNGKPGFYVVTPLLLAGGDGRAILVQRGWVPRNFLDRASLPRVETPAGEVALTGRMAPTPAKLYELGGAVAGPIRQNLDLAAFAAETGLKLLDASVLETGPPSQGLLRDWPDIGSAAAKNYGYAVQWWAMSALIAILYAWFQFIAPRRRLR